MSANINAENGKIPFFRPEKWFLAVKLHRKLSLRNSLFSNFWLTCNVKRQGVLKCPLTHKKQFGNAYVGIRINNSWIYHSVKSDCFCTTKVRGSFCNLVSWLHRKAWLRCPCNLFKVNTAWSGRLHDTYLLFQMFTSFQMHGPSEGKSYFFSLSVLRTFPTFLSFLGFCSTRKKIWNAFENVFFLE